MTYYLRGQVSKATGLNIETLRFYEKNGLIPIPKRTSGGYRIYTEDIINRLEFIKRAKNSGFTLDEIRQLLLILDSKSIDQQFVSNLLEKKINDIDQEISELYEKKAFLLKVKENIYNPDKCLILQSLLKA
jgi:DNA-binding transcriptional MerR regulator